MNEIYAAMENYDEKWKESFLSTPVNFIAVNYDEALEKNKVHFKLVDGFSTWSGLKKIELSVTYCDLTGVELRKEKYKGLYRGKPHYPSFDYESTCKLEIDYMEAMDMFDLIREENKKMKTAENSESIDSKTKNDELKIKINVVGEIKYSDVEPGAVIIVGYPDDNGYFEPWQFRTVTKVYGNGHIFESFKDGYYHEDNDEFVKYEALRYSAGKAPYEFDVLKLN